jgi:membrane protein required for colicin V production
MNWLDIVLVVIMVVTAIIGIFKGLVKQVVGLAAFVAGLVLASLYYEQTAGLFNRVTENVLLRNFLGFLVIFVVVLVAGAILGHLISKTMKGPLAIVNRLFGGAFGLLKAVLICGLLVFGLVSLEFAKPVVQTSVVAPVCINVTNAAIKLIPQNLWDRIYASYKEIRESRGKHGQEN